MTIRYFDSQGRQITYEELCTMNITTPIMEHIVASVVQRVSGEPESVSTLDKQVDSGKLV